MDHAGVKTALKMYLTPDDVRHELVIPGITVGNEYWKPEYMGNKITIYMPFHEFTKYGHIGDPTKSTVEMGGAAFELIVNEVERLVRVFHEQGLKAKV